MNLLIIRNDITATHFSNLTNLKMERTNKYCKEYSSWSLHPGEIDRVQTSLD